MTYTPDEPRDVQDDILTALINDARVTAPMIEPFKDALDAVLPGHDRRIQAETLRDAADDYDGLWPSVRTWLQDRAAALAAPVEPTECNDECMRTGFCVCDDGRVWNDCPMHGAHPAPPVEQPPLLTPTPEQRETHRKYAATVDVTAPPVEQPPTQEKR